MILYVPSSVTAGSNAPALVWYLSNLVFMELPPDGCNRIHGGSFVEGSATGAGLDGSALATATGAIVAVIQYRLGAVSRTLI